MNPQGGRQADSNGIRGLNMLLVKHRHRDWNGGEDKDKKAKKKKQGQGLNNLG